jgi:hypothetical protein
MTERMARGRTELVCSWIDELKIKPKPITREALSFAIDWLGSYEADQSDTDVIQAVADTISYLEKSLRRLAISEVKREYAKVNGLKFSQVRIINKVKA